MLRQVQKFNTFHTGHKVIRDNYRYLVSLEQAKSLIPGRTGKDTYVVPPEEPPHHMEYVQFIIEEECFGSLIDFSRPQGVSGESFQFLCPSRRSVSFWASLACKRYR